MQKLVSNFVLAAGLLLLITATAKIISIFGSARILSQAAPLLPISFRVLLCISGTFELIVALTCLFSKRTLIQLTMIAWLASNFLIYRIALVAIGYHKPCPCLGNLTGILHLSPEAADSVMKLVLAYLLIGSYAILLWFWIQKQKRTDLKRLN
jgi:hypothetical protein